MKSLDVITVGRAGVDFYGTQIGGRLEDMGSFDKYIGGSPTNMACGTARLGLKSALLSRVGDEHLGRFVREELLRHGVSVDGLRTDPERLTALAILGIRDEDTFPLIFYREDCADMALCQDDVEEAFIASARAVAVTGTHLSHDTPRAALLKSLNLARKHGGRTALDIDYRPNLWKILGHGDGESRYAESASVTSALQETLHLFDLIVGTEEEFHIAGGTTDTLAALRNVRSRTDATLVCKRGALGATAFEGDFSESWEVGQTVPGFPIEVFNVLGAGDGFMSGLLKGWLDDEDWPTALKYANACGALAVSRHGCTPAYPSWQELQFFLDRGVRQSDLRNDRDLEQAHWVTNRQFSKTGDWSTLRAFAFDHRAQLEEMPGYTADKGRRFKELCLDAALAVQKGRPGFGVLCDARIGETALHRASGTGLWIGRPAELPGSRPIAFEASLGPDLGGLTEWPRDNVVKLLVFAHPDDAPELRAQQEKDVFRLFTAARRNNLEFLLEVIPSKVAPMDNRSTAILIQQFYQAGIYPDWWKLEPLATDAEWSGVSRVIERYDPDIRGIVVLGLDAPEADLSTSFALAAKQPLVKGFAVGRTIFGNVAKSWMTGDIDDVDAVDEMARLYGRLCSIWDAARSNTLAA